MEVPRFPSALSAATVAAALRPLKTPPRQQRWQHPRQNPAESPATRLAAYRAEVDVFRKTFGRARP